MSALRVPYLSDEYLAYALLIAVACGFNVVSFNLYLIENKINVSGEYLCPDPRMEVQIQSLCALAETQD